MKKLITAIIIMINYIAMTAQTENDSIIYLIFTSQNLQQGVETSVGIRRKTSSIQSYNSSKYKSPPINFSLQSKPQKIDESFSHFNYKDNVTPLSQMRKAKPDGQMEILIKPFAYLDSIKTIDLDKKFPCMTQKEVTHFCRDIMKKIIYVIDRNDMTTDSIQLIEVQYIASKFGDSVLINKEEE